MTVADALQTLGLKRPVSRGSIKKAFREKSKLHHPDVAGDDGAGFLKIKAAYDFLGKKTEGEINYLGQQPLYTSARRGELVITDFPFLVFLEKLLAKYYRFKSKRGIGFLLHRFAKLIRYLFTNPKNSTFRKWVQLLAMIIFSVTILPIMLALLIVGWPFFLLVRYFMNKKI